MNMSSMGGLALEDLTALGAAVDTDVLESMPQGIRPIGSLDLVQGVDVVPSRAHAGGRDVFFQVGKRGRSWDGQRDPGMAD